MFQGGDGVSKILWLGSIPRVLAIVGRYIVFDLLARERYICF